MAPWLGTHFYDTKQQEFFCLYHIRWSPSSCPIAFVDSPWNKATTTWSWPHLSYRSHWSVALYLHATMPSWQGVQTQRKLYLALSSDILRRDTWQFIHFQLSSQTCVALAWKRDEEPGHAATHIITLCIYQTIRQSIIINLPSSRELACFIFLHARNL